jgi:hypothetical protein
VCDDASPILARPRRNIGVAFAPLAFGKIRGTLYPGSPKHLPEYGMSLATVTESDFDAIYHHLATRNPRYRNMHLRQACTRNGQRDLRYLHAMYASTRTRLVEGAISGPGLFLRYTMGKQLNVLEDDVPAKALARIARRFLPEILGRVALEQEGSTYPPNRTEGQYYLMRRIGGIPASHATCRRAVTAGVLDERFVAQLAAWDLALLCP